MQIPCKVGPLTITFNLHATPQAHYSEQILALMQLQAFYYLIHYPDEFDNNKQKTEQNIHRLREDHICFMFPGSLKRSDWGNSKAVEIVRRTRGWKPHLIVNSAQGFFKAEIRRHKKIFFWALEWNQNFRQMGFLRPPGSIPNVEIDLPEEPLTMLTPSFGTRLDKPLKEPEDLLFKIDEADTSQYY